MNISVRAEAPIAGLTFFTLVEGKVLSEACRVNMTTAHLRAIANVICRSINYYPTKAAAAPKTKKKR